MVKSIGKTVDSMMKRELSNEIKRNKRETRDDIVQQAKRQAR